MSNSKYQEALDRVKEVYIYIFVMSSISKKQQLK